MRSSGKSFEPVNGEVINTEEKALWQVDVALPVPIRKTFSYLIPEGWDSKGIQEGRRVLVPFGSRIMFGVTWSEPTHFKDVEQKQKYRRLIHYEAELQILSPEIKKLVQWMQNYYQAPLGELLKMALPPGVLEHRDPVFELSPKGRTHMEAGAAQPGTSFTGPDAELSFLAGGPLTRKEWSRVAGHSITMKSITRWESLGLVRPIFPGKAAPSTPRVPVVEVTQLGQSLALEEVRKRLRKDEILSFLKARVGPVRVSVVKELFPTAFPYLKKLEKAGLIVFSEMEEHHFENHEDSAYGARPELNEEQASALQTLNQEIKEKAFSPYLLFGVTGSGKTEVYLRAVEYSLEMGKQALFLVPEIALTPMMRARITQRFGERLAILHSAVPKRERAASWARILAGKVDVVLGARSGIFAPLPRLGLIIVDEEHDTSYKQAEGPRYQARDLALVRGKFSRAVVVLGSATPSLESWKNAEDGKFGLITLSERATQAALPAVDIVDMREEFKAQRKRPVFSRLLLSTLQQVLSKDEQAMLLLNRRGYHSFLLCRRCGQSAQCTNCDVTLTYHKKNHQMKCHYCDYSCCIPDSCVHCGAHDALLQFFGEGTQLVQEELEKLFPGTQIDRLDRDRLTRKDDLESILTKFRQGETRVLIGTQMIAKGHDFHNVTLVGILNADQGLRIPDFRSAENTFQLITQVAGRSGRGQKAGRVIIQSYMPEHYSIQCAKTHDFRSFVNRELLFREGMFYPPYSFLLNLVVQNRDENLARQVSDLLVNLLRKTNASEHIRFLGPVKAPVSKVKGKYRYQILIKSESRKVLNGMAREVVHHLERNQQFKNIEVFLDVDPFQFS